MVVGIFVLTLFAAQLLRIQGLESAATAAEARSQRIATEVIPAQRGTIYDAHDTVLATSQERRKVVIDQTAVPAYKRKVDGETTTVGVQGAAEQLAPLLQTDPATLVGALTGDQRYVVLATGVTPSTWREIYRLGIPGVYSERTSIRSYPQSSNVSPLVGFVRPNDQTAGGGLELMLDQTLKGKDGKAVYEVGRDGSRLPNARSDVSEQLAGRDVRLTIDNDIQWYAQNALAQQVKKTGAESGTVVVQRRTGELVALASYPSFDPTKLNSNKGTFANLAFSDVFEPGSTTKVITVAAGLEEGKVTPDTPVVIPNTIRRYDRTLRDSHPHPTLYRTVTGTLAESSNIGTIFISETMAPKTIDQYYRKFGLGTTSGSGFPGESAGLLPPVEKWGAVQRYTMSYGQGISATAMQVSGVFQTIANGGVRVAPTLVSEVQDADGRWQAAPTPKSTRVVSDKTAREVSHMLEGVVTDQGTAPQARVPGYRVAGKTGTADRYSAEVGGYSGKTASFVGYAPAGDPQLVVTVIIQRPTRGYYGGATAGPVFKDVMTYALQREQVAPSAEDAKPPKLTIELDGPPPAGTEVLKDRGTKAGG